LVLLERPPPDQNRGRGLAAQRRRLLVSRGDFAELRGADSSAPEMI